VSLDNAFVLIEGHPREKDKIETPTCNTDTWGTLYDGVGSVKRHLWFTSREGSFFSSLV